MPASLSRRRLIGGAIRAVATIAVGFGAEGLLARALAAADLFDSSGSAPAGHGRGGPHPEPRPGIDASHMVPAETVRAQHPDAAPAFDEARTIPEILDGIRCQCGCADGPGMRSLLSCYEGDEAMALSCPVCEGQARLAYRLHRKGQSLDRIRAAIDARYGA
jgi:hypothetical protein